MTSQSVSASRQPSRSANSVKPPIRRIVLHDQYGKRAHAFTQSGAVGRGTCRQAGGRKPERVDGADDAAETVEIHRLGDEAVGLLLVGAGDVAFGVRGGNHQHGNRLEVGVALDFAQHRAAVRARQVEIEHDDIRPRRGAVAATPAEVVDRVVAVLGGVKAAVDARLLQRLDDEADVGRVVFDQQDFDRAIQHRATPPFQEW